MRHSDIRLTMQTYTHLELMDTANAVESLPWIETPQEGVASLTGTDGPDGVKFSRPKYVPSCRHNLTSSVTIDERAPKVRFQDNPRE